MAPHTIALISGTSRTLQHLIAQALPQGHSVRAVVRSAAKFHAAVDKHKSLTTHELDFKDIDALRPVLDGVDVVYVALNPTGKALMHPTSLNLDAVVAITTILHDRIAPGERSPTKVVLLTSDTINPNTPYEPFGESLLPHQFVDLRAAAKHLKLQASWLDFVLVAPGMLVDSEPSNVTGVKLQAEGPVATATSYSRLAAALQLAGKDSAKWTGKFVVPIPTEAVPMGMEPLRNLGMVVNANLWYRWLPALTRWLTIASLGAGLGYWQGARDGGVWLKQLGWK